jgi:hypothetical protein
MSLFSLSVTKPNVQTLKTHIPAQWLSNLRFTPGFVKGRRRGPLSGPVATPPLTATLVINPCIQWFLEAIIHLYNTSILSTQIVF